MPSRNDETVQAVRRVNRVVANTVTTAYTPDFSDGDTHILTVGGNLTIAAPIGLPGAPKGRRTIRYLRFVIIQDGTGGRTVTWNAAFKVVWSNTGNTANLRSSISFAYDGVTIWQHGAQGPYV